MVDNALTWMQPLLQQEAAYWASGQAVIDVGTAAAASNLVSIHQIINTVPVWAAVNTEWLT